MLTVVKFMTSQVILGGAVQGVEMFNSLISHLNLTFALKIPGSQGCRE